jgi:hypothetical protein
MATENIKVFTVKVNTETGKIAIDGLTKKFVQAETAFKKLNAEAANLTKKSLNPLSDATGLAGAAVTELGRGITDLNYGFPAIANNISQLGSLFTILIARAGSLQKALQLIGKTLKGPLGILLAFQAIVTVIESFAKKAKEANGAIKDLTNSFSKQATSLQSYLKILQESNIPLKERKELVEELNEEHKDLNIQLDEEGRLTEESKNQTLLYIDALKEKAKAQAIITQIQNLYQKQLELESKTIEEETTFFDNLLASFANFSGVQAGYIPNQKIINKEDVISARVTDRRTEANKKLAEQIDELIKKLVELGVIPEENNKKALKNRKGFTQQFLDFNNEILQSENRLTKLTTVNREEQIKADSDLLIKRAEERQKDFALRQQERVNAIQDAKERAKAQIKADESIKQSLESLSAFKQQIEVETNAKIENFRLNSLTKNLGILYQELEQRKILELEFQTSMATNEMDRIELSRQLENQKTATVIGNLELEREKAILAGESVIGIDAKIATERDKIRKVNAKLDEKERKTKIAIANEVGNAIIGIAGEGSAVGKAVAVAMAVMNTKEAITNALGAKPYGPWNIAQALAVGAFGFKQVQDIINTKIPGKAGSAAGVSAGGAGITTEAPDFNVVGIGQASQLGQVIGSQFGQPIRAYVVSNDVNTGQALERSITGNAKLD